MTHLVTITDSKIPETQAETDPLNKLLTTSDTVGPLLSIHFVVGNVRLFELVYITQE